MTRPWYAGGARQLLDERKRGMKPPEPVVVHMSGPVQRGGTPLQVNPEMPIARLDWRMLVNLEVWLCADHLRPVADILTVVLAIAHVKPRDLILRFTDQRGFVHDIAVGTGHHTLGLPEHGIAPEHSFLFGPINLSGSRIGRAFTAALARHSHEVF